MEDILYRGLFLGLFFGGAWVGGMIMEWRDLKRWEKQREALREAKNE